MTFHDQQKAGETVVRELDRLRERNRRFNIAMDVVSLLFLAVALWVLFELTTY